MRSGSIVAPLRVGFREFWSGFRPEDFFVPLLAEVSGRYVEVTSASGADVCITSVNETRWRRWNRRLSRAGGVSRSLGHSPDRGSLATVEIWYTGENTRPPAYGYDLTLSFDLDDFEGRNVYLPLLEVSLDWFGSASHPGSPETQRAGVVLTPKQASQPRAIGTEERPRFACAFIGNMESRRLEAIRALSRIGQVDVFGTAVGRPVRSKSDVAHEYRYMLCFENDLYPGYVTEKPLEAYAVGCIPLWSGIDRGHRLNPDAVVNADEYSSLADFCHFVEGLESDPTARLARRQAPLFTEQPNLADVRRALRAVLGSRGLCGI